MNKRQLDKLCRYAFSFCTNDNLVVQITKRQSANKKLILQLKRRGIGTSVPRPMKAPTGLAYSLRFNVEQLGINVDKVITQLNEERDERI